MIDLLFKEAVGPDKTALFWQQFKDNYVTRADIDYIARQGANTIRLPFNYKLFTDDDYMGQTGQKDGYERIDSIVSWCKANQLYLILDMHDCPEGQTGDNIDDGYGYPGFSRANRRNSSSAASGATSPAAIRTRQPYWATN